MGAISGLDGLSGGRGGPADGLLQPVNVGGLSGRPGFSRLSLAKDLSSAVCGLLSSIVCGLLLLVVVVVVVVLLVDSLLFSL